jgi:hypothetical protein
MGRHCLYNRHFSGFGGKMWLGLSDIKKLSIQKVRTMELRSGAWAKTYDAFCEEMLKNTKSLSLDKKLIAAIEDNKKVIANLKDIDRLINGFAMARDAQKAPFLDPFKKAVAAAEKEHVQYFKDLAKAIKDFGPKVKVQQKTFDKPWDVFVKKCKELSAQPDSQISGMESEIKAAGTLDKKAEDARKQAQKDSKKLDAAFLAFKKVQERTLEEDVANAKKHQQLENKNAAEHATAKKLYESKKEKMIKEAKEPIKVLKEIDIIAELGAAPSDVYQPEPFATIFKKSFVEDFNDEVAKIVGEICEPLEGLEKAMTKKGLDMGKEFPKVLSEVVKFAQSNQLKLGDGHKGAHAILQAGAATLGKLGPAVLKMPVKAK